MHPSHSSSPLDACPASAVIMATRLAKTPLAIADAHLPGSPIMFANDAFAALVKIDASALAGRLLGTLSASAPADIQPGRTTRFELLVQDEKPFPVALSTAPVPGADGKPFCLLCSLVDARGDGAGDAIARDAALLAQVALAAGDLMRESAAAADPGDPQSEASSASDIALRAVERATHVGAEDRP